MWFLLFFSIILLSIFGVEEEWQLAILLIRSQTYHTESHTPKSNYICIYICARTHKCRYWCLWRWFQLLIMLFILFFMIKSTIIKPKLNWPLRNIIVCWWGGNADEKAMTSAGMHHQHTELEYVLCCGTAWTLPSVCSCPFSALILRIFFF